MTAPSKNNVSGSIPQLAKYSNSTENACLQIYTVGLHMTIPVLSLDEHLPNNLILDQVQCNLLLDNKEFHRANETFEGDVSRHDFGFNLQCGAGQRVEDILAHMSVQVHLLTTEGGVAYEGEMSLDVFSAAEIAKGAVRVVLMPFRCTLLDSQYIHPIDILVSITPSPTDYKAETDAAGLDPCFPNRNEVKWTDGHVQQVRVASTEACWVKTEAEDELFRNTTDDTYSPIDISHHKDIKPDAPSLPLPCNNVPMQSGGSTLDYKASTQSRTASTEANISSSAINETDTHEINYLLGVTERLKKQFKMRRYATSRINPRFRDGPYRLAPLSAIELEIRKLSNSIAQLDNKRKK